MTVHDRQVRIVIADDNPVVRRGLRAILDAQEDMTVVGEAADGRAAVDLVRRVQPDLALLDVRMPVLAGFDAAARLTPEFRVLMLSYSDDRNEVAKALAAGAQGYLVHGRFDVDELLRAVRGALQGESALSPSVATVAVRLAREHLRSSPPGHVPTLTTREVEVMEAVCRGLSNAEIAKVLFLSESTVRNHVTHILARLGARSRAQAIAVWTGRAPAPGAGRPGPAG